MFELDMTATVSKQTVEAMVKQCVETQTGRKVASVELTGRVVGVGGYRDDDVKTAQITGATVTFANESRDTSSSWVNRSSLASQIDAVERDITNGGR